MKNQKIDKITDGALFAVFGSSFFLPESTLSFLILSTILVGCLVFRFKPTPLNPYFYLAPASLYLVANFFYIYFSETSGFLMFFSCASLGLLFLSVALKQSYRIPSEKYVNRPNTVKLFIVLYCSTTLLLAINSIASASFPLVTKIFQLVAYPVVSAICFGSLIAIASRRIWLALTLSSLYFGYTVIANLNANDFSRLSVLDYFVMLMLCFLFGVKHLNKFVVSGSKLIGAIFVLMILIQFFILFTFSESLRIGGDALIVSNAIMTIQEAAGNHQYLMPIFNGGLIFAPDFFWFDTKPKAYNSSAWFIENIMGMNATDYPWGVGVGLFASSYLYGGLAAVVIVFYLIGRFIGKLSQFTINSFWAGFLIYFLMRLPLSVLRMDETFMLGSFFPMIILLISFLFIFRKKINRAYGS